MSRVQWYNGESIHAKPLGMHTIHITNIVHKTSNENSRGTRTEIASFPGSAHMRTASDGKLGRAKARTAVGLVACSQTGETTVSYT